MVQFEGGFHLQSGRRSKGQRSQRPASAPCSLQTGSGTLVSSLDLPAPASSSLRLLFAISPGGRLLLLLKSNSNVTSLDKSSSFLKQAKLLLGLFLSLLSIEGPGSLHGWLCTSWGQKPTLFTYAFALVSKEGFQWFAPVPEIIQLDDLRDPS